MTRYHFDIRKKILYNKDMVKDNERLDDLEYKGLRIIQQPEGYCFTSDSVLLANLSRIKKGDRVCDLCTGSGVVALLVSAKFDPKDVVGVELQSRLADMATRSVKYNGYEERVTILNHSVQGIEKTVGCGVFDVVTCNPPYAPSEKKEDYTEEEICKTEACLKLEELIFSASKILKFGGSFFMVHKAYRLADAVCHMRNCGLEPKRLWLIQPKADKDVDAFVIEGKKGGKPHLLVPSPIVVYNEDGSYTDFARRIYGK